MYGDFISTTPLQLNLIESNFISNDAIGEGGVLKLVNANASIFNSTFDSNSAGTEGGALYLSCEDQALLSCFYNISQTTFTNNSATLNGGAIKYDFYRPEVSLDTVF